MKQEILVAKPEPLKVSAHNTAIVVNDMQNAFCTPGGYLDLLGFDISHATDVAKGVRRVLDAGRQAGVKIFHAQNGFHQDYKDAPKTSPIWLKSNALRYMREHPETTGKILTRGTWDYDFADGLHPQSDEYVLKKSRASCFAGTNLEEQLRAHGIHHVVVIGIAVNVGVEWTLREAMTKEFFGILVEDATMAAGGEDVYRSSVFNIEKFVGWVTTAEEFESTFSKLAV